MKLSGCIDNCKTNGECLDEDKHSTCESTGGDPLPDTNQTRVNSKEFPDWVVGMS